MVSGGGGGDLVGPGDCEFGTDRLTVKGLWVGFMEFMAPRVQGSLWYILIGYFGGSKYIP